MRHRETLSDVITSEISEFCLPSQRLENNDCQRQIYALTFGWDIFPWGFFVEMTVSL